MPAPIAQHLWGVPTPMSSLDVPTLCKTCSPGPVSCLKLYKIMEPALPPMEPHKTTAQESPFLCLACPVMVSRSSPHCFCLFVFESDLAIFRTQDLLLGILGGLIGCQGSNLCQSHARPVPYPAHQSPFLNISCVEHRDILLPPGCWWQGTNAHKPVQHGGAKLDA